MATGTVYRPDHWDTSGDPRDADDNIVSLFGESSANIGEITGLIIGGPSGTSQTGAYPLPGMRGEGVSTSGLVGFPTRSRIQLQAGDIVQIDGRRFKLSGPILYGGTHPITGRPTRRSWISYSMTN